MPVGPIYYRSVRDVLRESSERESHPLPRLLADYLLDAIAEMQGDEQGLSQMVCTLLTDVMEGCCRFSTDLINRRRHPVLPADPQEQERSGTKRKRNWSSGMATEMSPGPCVTGMRVTLPRRASCRTLITVRSIAAPKASITCAPSPTCSSCWTKPDRQKREQTPARDTTPQEEDRCPTTLTSITR